MFLSRRYISSLRIIEDFKKIVIDEIMIWMRLRSIVMLGYEIHIFPHPEEITEAIDIIFVFTQREMVARS